MGVKVNDTSKLTINNDGNDNVVFETLGGAGV